MNLITNNNITNYNISNDWGWYVDTENNSYISPKIYIPYKKIVTNLPSIEEEYNYHLQNYKDVENLTYEFDLKNDRRDILYKIGSTTLLMVLLTYIIFFLI